MRIKNDQAGLTLVELLVTIVVASIVTLAACTMLLFGLRINNQSTKTSRGQNTVQVLMEALEDVAAEGDIKGIVDTPEKWQLINGDGNPIFSYSKEQEIIYTGAIDEELAEAVVGSVILDNVRDSYATLQYNGLLTVYVKTDSGEYYTSINCRTKIEDKNEKDTVAEDLITSLQNSGATTGQGLFLKILAEQYGSDGRIIPEGGTYKFYSEWYLQDTDYSHNKKWNKDTPWCACYISWALAQCGYPRPADALTFYAHVDDYVDFFGGYENLKGEEAEVGRVIFFNFDTDVEADHMGVVISIDDNYIYTIEGNTAGKVDVRKYDIKDKRILGYGKLWES
jgi:prepilin-type N-terminal cleavage/methylation domain-containing protein